MALARQERWDDAAGAFDEGIALSVEMGYPHGEARARYEKGVMQAARGSVAEAEADIGEALGIFRRLGARLDEQRAEQALARIRAEPR
ncbi:MAG TPA: hypothetical protein VKX16_15965 [Chloroflexota bacterium]|nr:hypothetical protein [Chloroflexota bacterium]